MGHRPQRIVQVVILEVDVMCAYAHHASMKVQREEGPRASVRADLGRDWAKGFGTPERVGEGHFRSRRHVRWRTPRKHENAGPVPLGPVSHRARLRVERSTEGRDHQRTLSYFRSRRHVRWRTPRKHENTARRRPQSLGKAFGPAERIAQGCFRSGRHVRWRTPRKHENVPCRLSSPLRGQVVSLTICSTVDIVFACARGVCAHTPQA